MLPGALMKRWRIFYVETDNIIINSNTHHKIVMGDFNDTVVLGEIRETCTG